MEDVIEQMIEIVPELLPVYLRRIDVLHMIYREGPIGRKQLAERLQMTERPLRTETEFLKQQQFIVTSAKGMMVTGKGEQALINAQNIWRHQSSVHVQEKLLKQTLDICQVKIVSGDADSNRLQNYELGLQVSQYLNKKLARGHHTLAITGGTTMLDIAKNMQESLANGRDFTVVAARGGLGDQLAAQANTISDILAQRLHGRNMVLYTPEKLSQETYRLLLMEPSIQQTLQELKRANILLFSVGDAKIMAERREVDLDEAELIAKAGAVGEAFGCFFDADGKIVYRMPRIGFQIEDLASVAHPILVAGGSSKAKAIAAFAKLAPKQLVLITDHGAANQVLNGETH